jgi:hypothetical protein
MLMNSKILTLVAIAVAATSGSAWATTIFSDDYSTFTPGNLVGQHGWAATVGATTLPLQVSGGNVLIPAGQTVDNQDAVKNFGSTVAATTYAGMSLNVSSAPVVGGGITPSYFFALLESTGGFANARLTAIDNSASVPNTYLLEARYTGQAGNPFVAGTPLNYGQTYNVVEKAIITATGAGEGIQLYVNPTSNNEGAQTPYLDTISQTTTGQLIPPAGFTAATFSQFGSATVKNVGVAIDHLNVATTFGEAANVVPEPATFGLLSLGALTLVNTRKLIGPRRKG